MQHLKSRICFECLSQISREVNNSVDHFSKASAPKHTQRKPELQCVKPSRRQHRVRDEVRNCLVVVPLRIGQGWANLSALLAMVSDAASEWSDQGVFSN